MRTFTNIIALLIAISSIVGCGSNIKLNSQRPETPIISDGEISEWQNNLNYIEEKNVSLGFYNDDDNLYISFKTTDRSIIRQTMGRGFTIWLDAKGGQGKRFGIRFPIGRMGGSLMRDMSRGESQGQPDFDDMEKRFEGQLTIYELITPDEKEPRLFNTDELSGIKLDINMNRDEGMVYELQVPLNSSEQNPFAIALDGSQTVGVGFESAKIDREQIQSQGGMGGGTEGRAGGSYGGGGRGGRGMGGGGRGGSGMSGMGMSEQFKLWTIVELNFPASE